MKFSRKKTEYMSVNDRDTGVTVKIQGAELVKVNSLQAR